VKDNWTRQKIYGVFLVARETGKQIVIKLSPHATYHFTGGLVENIQLRVEDIEVIDIEEGDKK